MLRSYYGEYLMNAITDTRRINETTYTPISFKVENENICIEVSVTDSRIHELSVEGKTNPLSIEIGKILTHELIGLPLADFLSMGSMILLEKNNHLKWFHRAEGNMG